MSKINKMNLEKNTLIFILTLILFTLIAYIFFFNLSLKELDSLREDKVVSQHEKLKKGDLYQVDTKMKTDINKLKKDIRNYYINTLNYTADKLSDDINVEKVKEDEGFIYSWTDVYTNSDDTEKLVVMFYPTMNNEADYKLISFNLPSIDSVIEQKPERSPSDLIISDSGIKITLLHSLLGYELDTPIDPGKLKHMLPLWFNGLESKSGYRYEEYFADDNIYSYSYIASDNIIFNNDGACIGPGNNPKLPIVSVCSTKASPFVFDITCEVDKQLNASLCDKLVNSIQEDSRNWKVLYSTEEIMPEKTFIPFK